jgi:hypothetical protein
LAGILHSRHGFVPGDILDIDSVTLQNRRKCRIVYKEQAITNIINTRDFDLIGGMMLIYPPPAITNKGVANRPKTPGKLNNLIDPDKFIPGNIL